MASWNKANTVKKKYCSLQYLVKGQGQFCWESLTHSSVTLPGLLCNETEPRRDRRGAGSRRQHGRAAEASGREVTCCSRYGQANGPGAGAAASSDWPGKNWIQRHQLISVRTSFSQTYHRARTVLDEAGKWVMRLVEITETCMWARRDGPLVSRSLSLAHTGSSTIRLTCAHSAAKAGAGARQLCRERETQQACLFRPCSKQGP